MQMCVGGRGGDSWGADQERLPPRRSDRLSYSFTTDRHPDVLDSFDNVMAAAVHLRGKVGGRPIPNLDDVAYRALCGYYGACADGVAGNYAADVLARARGWERSGTATLPGVPPLGASGALAWPVSGPVTSQVLRAPRLGGVPSRRRHRRAERHADPRRRGRPRVTRPVDGDLGRLWQLRLRRTTPAR